MSLLPTAKTQPKPNLADLTVTILSEFGIPAGFGMLGRPVFR